MIMRILVKGEQVTATLRSITFNPFPFSSRYQSGKVELLMLLSVALLIKLLKQKRKKKIMFSLDDEEG